MTARRSKEDCAIEVWVALETAGSDGLTLIELIDATGLTRDQVRRGLSEINHVKQLADEQPIVVDPHTWLYVLPEYISDLLPWTWNRIRDLTTRLHAEETRLAAATAKWPDKVRPHLPRQVHRLIEDLTDVLAELRDVA